MNEHELRESIINTQNNYISHINNLNIKNKQLLETIEQLKEENNQLSGITGQLKIENEQLKAKLQNCDKVSLDKFNNHNIMAATVSRDLSCGNAHASEDVINCPICLPEWYKSSERRNKELLNRLHQLQESKPTRKPHKCPVCCGDGKKYIYSMAPAFILRMDGQGRIYEFCKSCNGNGIVWEHQ